MCASLDVQENQVYVSLVPDPLVTRIPAGTPYVVKLRMANLYSVESPTLEVVLVAEGTVPSVSISAGTLPSGGSFTGTGPWTFTVAPLAAKSVVDVDLSITLTGLGNSGLGSFGLRATPTLPVTLNGGDTAVVKTDGSSTPVRPVVRGMMCPVCYELPSASSIDCYRHFSIHDCLDVQVL